MNDDVIQDLKQFIAANTSQQIANIRSDIKSLDKKLSVKIDSLSSSVAEAIDITNEETDKQLKDHEKRIHKLERAMN